jgi:hypothetical protein
VRPSLIGVQEHCWRLALVLHELALLHPECGVKSLGLSLTDAAAWLDVAASIGTVTMNTARFDASISFCSGAANHELQRSEALSEFGKLTTLFAFTWSSIEVLSQVIHWPEVPAALRGKDKPSAIERMTFTLYSVVPIAGYINVLDHLRSIRPLKLQPKRAKAFVGPAGEALNEIRFLRNALAHGWAPQPGPEVSPWQSGSTSEGHAALVSTRLALLTIQMLLAARFGTDELPIPWESSIESRQPLATVTAEMHLPEVL